MLVTPGVVETLRARSRTISTMRRLLEARDFLEVRGGSLLLVAAALRCRAVLEQQSGSAQRCWPA